jgi:cytochrome P450
MIGHNIPDVDLDLYSADSLANPYGNYAILRDAAPIVRLSRYDFFVMSRFADVQSALKNSSLFSSASGVGLNDLGNAVLSRSTLASDDPLHAERRAVLFRKLTPGNLNSLRARMTEEAEKLIESLVHRKSFDAAADLSRHLPATVVYELLGVPNISVDTLLEWTKGGFNSLGPAGSLLTAAGLEASRDLLTYALSCTPERVKPGGWADYLFEEARKGAIEMEQASALIFDYLGPSLDTTITATTNAVKLFGEHPDQWQALRARPAAIPNAINEVVRLESPVQAFSRLVTEDTKWGDQSLPRGARVLLLYGSANRDERRWDQPERFDIGRANTDHIGFGHGVHSCAGANLARLEMTALLTAMIARIEEIRIDETEVLLNNFLRGFRKLQVTVRAAKGASVH